MEVRDTKGTTTITSDTETTPWLLLKQTVATFLGVLFLQTAAII